MMMLRSSPFLMGEKGIMPVDVAFRNRVNRGLVSAEITIGLLRGYFFPVFSRPR